MVVSTTPLGFGLPQSQPNTTIKSINVAKIFIDTSDNQTFTLPRSFSQQFFNAEAQRRRDAEGESHFSGFSLRLCVFAPLR
jgi:hypothetical protein